MRDELIKLDRYQKQFKFLFKNNIETGFELSDYQKAKEGEINALVEERNRLYASRTEENETEIKEKAEKINEKLIKLRVDVRMCKAIFKDSYRISEKYSSANALKEQAEKEMKENEYKRRGR